MTGKEPTAMSCRFRKEESSSEDGSDMNEFTKAENREPSGVILIVIVIGINIMAGNYEKNMK